MTFDRGAVENCLFSKLILSLLFFEAPMDRNNTPSLIRVAMLDWYDACRRDLPWRSHPSDRPDPYHVWLSEVMLQQTTVAAVKPYFEKFIKIWPTIQDLAQTEQEDVLREWAGLGYYSRARNLYKCAVSVANDYNGFFPSDTKALKKLPGIGDYTAAAIRSIAYDIPSTVIDGNVERVISRLYRIDTPLPDSKPLIRNYAGELFEGDNTDRPSCFAQSMMDLGAMICTPSSPKCDACPIGNGCKAYENGDAARYPKRLKKKTLPQKHAVVFLNVRDGEIEIEKRPEKGMLGGMPGFPTSDWTDVKIPLPQEYVTEESVRHVFTHFSLVLHPVIRNTYSENMIKFDQVDDIGLPTLFKKVWKLMKHKLYVIE